MNGESKDTLTLTITGNLTIARDELERLVRQWVIPTPPAPVQNPIKLEGDGKPPRLAFSVKETAEMLGMSPITIYRLMQRGLLRSSSALRCQVIAKTEIARFLKETSRAVY
jgi:hypothetical protein